MLQFEATRQDSMTRIHNEQMQSGAALLFLTPSCFAPLSDATNESKQCPGQSIAAVFIPSILEGICIRIQSGVTITISDANDFHHNLASDHRKLRVQVYIANNTKLSTTSPRMGLCTDHIHHSLT